MRIGSRRFLPRAGELCLPDVTPSYLCPHTYNSSLSHPSAGVQKGSIYRVIQEESAILWEMIVCVILRKKVHMNMGPILNGYRDIVKRKYGPSCEHEQQLHNKKHHN